MKIFEVFNQKVLPDDGPLRAVCDTCRYRIETSWKRNCKLKSSAVILAEAISEEDTSPFSTIIESRGQANCFQFQQKEGLSTLVVRQRRNM